MGELKNKKTLVLLPTIILDLFLLAIVLYYSFDQSAINIEPFASIIDNISLVALFIVAPITFFVIFFFLRKQTKPEPKLGVGKSILLVVGILVAELLLTQIMSIFTSLIASYPQGAEVVQGGSIDLQLSPLNILLMSWQLFGEEATKLSIFFILFGATSYKKESRVRYWVAWLISVVIFGLLHLPAYGFDIVQCVVVIGLPSILFGYLWKKTENPFLLWVTHVAYNLAVMGLALIFT